MGKEFFDDEAQQHAADLDIVREIRHNDASLYQLAHGRGARWQFDQLKSQLEEKDARIAELEKQLESARVALQDVEMSPRILHKDNLALNMQAIAAKWLEENKNGN